MMKRLSIILFLVLSIAAVTAPVQAADSISYRSQPDEIAIFMNNIAFARDTISMPGGVDVTVVLPGQVFQDTLVLSENGSRVPTYRVSRSNEGQIMLQWQSATTSDLREITLEYLLTGVSWTPKYELWLGDDQAETVDFDFFAQIVNDALSLDAVHVRLVAGRVDTSQQLNDMSTMTANQAIVGYDRSGAGETLTGAASIQHIYEIGSISAVPGDIVYTKLQQNTLPARRVLFWNAQTDTQVRVIYKVKNESELPFAEGIVRAYQNDLFLGSDYVELTPIGSEGSITVGKLQDVRVNRNETQTAVSGWSSRGDTRHDIELTLSNFSSAPVEIEMVDYYPYDALDFTFSVNPERQSGNLFRWHVAIQPGDTVTITYQYYS